MRRSCLLLWHFRVNRGWRPVRLSYESSCPWQRWSRARDRVEVAAVAARFQALLRARQWRYRRRRRMCCRGFEEPRFTGTACDQSHSRPHRCRSRAPADAGCGRRVSAQRLANLRTHESRRATGIEQELCQGVHAAAPHPDGEIRDLHQQGRGARGAGALSYAHCGEG